MLPLLVHLSDGNEHSNQETLKVLAEYFKLTDEEIAERLPSGLQTVFTNRAAWAKSHLKAAGLIESPRRGFYKISPRGLEVLRKNPAADLLVKVKDSSPVSLKNWFLSFCWRWIMAVREG